jgi:hypothetical protein
MFNPAIGYDVYPPIPPNTSSSKFALFYSGVVELNKSSVDGWVYAYYVLVPDPSKSSTEGY